MNDELIRVVVVDDHTLMRQGLVGLLGDEPGIEVVGQAGDAHSARDAIEACEPDVILLDIGLPGMSGLELAGEFTQSTPSLAVLMVTMHDRDDYLFQALQAGAAGYVLKGSDVQELVAAVRAVARGETYVSQALTGKLVADYLTRAKVGDDTATLGGLSDREREVLVLVADGMTSAEIAERLFLSPHTVQTHRDHIMTKLDLHSRVELTKYAIRKGLIQLEP
jgi:two-component system response regulator NreC